MRSTLFALTLGLAWAAPAAAGPATDQLGQCLVKASGPQDRLKLMRWMFAAMALHPAIEEMAKISIAQRALINKEVGALFERLITVDCRQPVIDALRADGPAAMQGSFQVLGQIAAGGLMQHPAVTAGIGELSANVDQSKIKALYQEAGSAAR